MLECTISGIRCRLSLLFPAVLLYLLYFDPSGVVVFGFLASCIHESGHIVTACFLDRPPKELVLSCFGIRMVTRCYTDCSVWQDTAIALSGPVTNMIIGVVLWYMSVDPICYQIHLVIGALNLLPVLPLDGGRVISAVIGRYGSLKFQNCIEWGLFVFTIIPLLCLGLMLAFHPSHNITLLLVTVYLIFVRLFYNGN